MDLTVDITELNPDQIRELAIRLQAEGRFTPTAFVPVLWNAVIIICLVGVSPFLPSDERIWVYAIGILLGTVAQLLYLLPYLRGLGPFPLSLGFGNHLVRRVLILMLPVTVGLGLININALVDAIFSTLVSEQAVRAIDAAFRLYILPQGIFSVAISTVLFPTISRMAANHDWPGLRRSVDNGLRQIFFLLLPASAFLMVLSMPVVRLVYQRGAFDGYSTSITSEALFFFTIGLVFNGSSLLLIRAFFSMQQPWLPTAIAGGGVALNAVLDALTPTLKQRVEAKGFVLVHWGHGGWLQVFSKQPVTTLADRPDLVTVSYNYLSSGIPQSTTYIKGALSDDIRAWVTKQSASGDKDYVVTVQNLSATDLYINVAAYRVGT